MQTIYNLLGHSLFSRKKDFFFLKIKQDSIYFFIDGLKKREKDVHTFKVLSLFNDVL